MAKTPKGSMDEEEIVRRRDGVASSDDPLAPKDRRALADARLRALAFALGAADQGVRAEGGKVSDADLLAYLLDALPRERQHQLEQALRGDRHVLSRLMALRLALDAQPDERDRRRDPARMVRRHVAGRVEIRRAGELLQFREVPVLRQTSQTEAFVLPSAPAAALREFAPAPRAFRKIERPRLRSDRDTEARLLSVLERVRSHFDAGRHLIDEMEALLERPQGTDRREGSQSRAGDLLRRGSIERLGEQLRELLHQFQIVAKTASMLLGSVEAAPRTERSFLEAPLRFEANLLSAFALGDHETWADAMDVEAGPWSVTLSGTTLPTPRLGVAVGERKHETSYNEPFLTLVRPRHGFETATIDSEGRARFPLPPGESVLLVQADEVWEVRLSFRNGGGSSGSRRLFEE